MRSAIFVSRVEIAAATPRDLPPKVGEMLLVDLVYEDYRLNGSNRSFYRKIPHSGEFFEVKGVRYKNGVFINPVDNNVPGSITYDISDFDKEETRFRKLRKRVFGSR